MSDVFPPQLGMSEEDYANQEEWTEKNAWEKKGKGKKVGHCNSHELCVVTTL